MNNINNEQSQELLEPTTINEQLGGTQVIKKNTLATQSSNRLNKSVNQFYDLLDGVTSSYILGYN